MEIRRDWNELHRKHSIMCTRHQIIVTGVKPKNTETIGSVAPIEGMKNANKNLTEISEVCRRRTNEIMSNGLWVELMWQVAGFCRHWKNFNVS